MKRLRITRQGKVKCPRNGIHVSIADCKLCDDALSVDTYFTRHVMCKRGGIRDPFINEK